MSSLREAAQQALDWLYDNDILHPTKVSEDLRAALAQQDEPVQDQRCRAEPRSDGDFVCDCKIGECLGRNAALAQQAEPVEPFGYWFPDKHQDAVCSGWFVRNPCDGKLDGKPGVPLYTAPPRCPNCASLEVQNNELDRRLAELQQDDWK